MYVASSSVRSMCRPWGPHRTAHPPMCMHPSLPSSIHPFIRPSILSFIHASMHACIHPSFTRLHVRRSLHGLGGGGGGRALPVSVKAQGTPIAILEASIAPFATDCVCICACVRFHLSVLTWRRAAAGTDQAIERAGVCVCAWCDGNSHSTPGPAPPAGRLTAMPFFQSSCIPVCAAFARSDCLFVLSSIMSRAYSHAHACISV